jgi:small-conductance mechanosensitive channel
MSLKDFAESVGGTENVVATIILLLSFFILRAAALGVVKKWSFRDADEMRSKLVAVKNAFLFVFFIGLLFIWGSELRSFAISLVAVAAALAIATKELIMCLMGGMLKASTKLFSIGDRIEVKGLRGEVTDHNLLVTTLFEIGPGFKSNQFTGRLLKIPNSTFVLETVLVEPKASEYTLAVFNIPLPIEKDLEKLEKQLLQAASEVCGPYYSSAVEAITTICQEEGVAVPLLEPRVLFDLVDSDSIEFHVRMPVPFNQKSNMEKQLLKLFFSSYERPVVATG